jgi:uncharacterized membrane protein
MQFFEKIILPLLIAATLGSGMVAGLLFVFSNVIMSVLAKQTPEHGMATMQAINIVILNPAFLLLFMGTLVVSAVHLMFAFTHWQEPCALVLMLAALVYVLGVFGITAACNVPLNDTLAGADAANPASVQLWREYLQTWTRWNHIRTIAAVVATILYALALMRFAGK